MDPGMALTAAAFDGLLASNPDCDLVLSLVGLPYDAAAMKYWQKAEARQRVPRLALVNAHIYELKSKIKAGLISVVLQNKPEVYDWQAAIPEDEVTIFSNRFIFITPENVDELAAKYHDLFKPDDTP